MTTTNVDSISKRYITYHKVKELQAQGHGMRAIARHLGLARNMVKRYWNHATFVPHQTAKRSNLFLYKGYLRRRWLAGETNVKDLLIETKNFGYNGSYTILANFLSTYHRLETELILPPARKANSYSGRRISRLLNQPASKWSTDEEAFLTHLLRHNESIRQVHELSEQFRQLMSEKSAAGLAKWCEDAEKAAGYARFLRGLRQDYAAIEQAFVSEWSNGLRGAAKRRVR